MQLPILCRRNIVKDLDLSRPLASRIGKHVEVLQQSLAICGDTHRAAAFAATAGILRPILSLGKVQPQIISSRLQRNVVAEISLPAGAINNRILCPPDVLDRTLYSVSTGEISVGIPKLPRMIDVFPR